MGSVAAQLFQVSSKMFDWVQVQALAGPLKDIQILLGCLGCVLRVVILFEGEPSPQSEVLRSLEQVFNKNISVICSGHLSPVSQSLPLKNIPIA